jgi:hypothetical protein
MVMDHACDQKFVGLVRVDQALKLSHDRRRRPGRGAGQSMFDLSENWCWNLRRNIIRRKRQLSRKPRTQI